MNADGTLACHRHAAIRHTIPDRLDRVADQLEDCLDLLGRYGLAEALQPAARSHRVSAQELRDAATRIRTAAEHIPRPGIASHPRTPPADPGGEAVHGTAGSS